MAASKRWQCPQCARRNDGARLHCPDPCGAARPWKRGGLHKVACFDCGLYTYATVATLEAAGLPPCWRAGCGATLQPDELELCLLLGLDDSPVVLEYARVHANKEASQRRALGWNQSAERHAAGTLKSMELAAADEMRLERRARARSNRLQALKPAAAPMPF